MIYNRDPIKQRRQALARKLAWITTVHHPSASVGEPRYEGSDEAFNDPEYSKTQNEYQEGIQKHIVLAIEKGRKDYKDQQDAGVF